MSQKLQEFKVGDTVLITEVHDTHLDNVYFNKVVTVIGFTEGFSNLTNSMEPAIRFNLNGILRYALFTSIRKLSKLEKAIR